MCMEDLLDNAPLEIYIGFTDTVTISNRHDIYYI